MWISLALRLAPYVIIAILVAVSVGLYKLHTHDLTEIGALKEDVKSAVAQGKACSDGVEKLRQAGIARDKLAAEAVEKSRTERLKLEHSAETTLQAAPSKPNDLCASALELSRQELQERKATP